MTFAVQRGDISMVFQQNLHHRAVAAQCGMMQGRLSYLAAGIYFSAVFQQQPRHLRSLHDGCKV
jgi:hypothetical protein